MTIEIDPSINCDYCGESELHQLDWKMEAKFEKTGPLHNPMVKLMKSCREIASSCRRKISCEIRLARPINEGS